MTAEVETMFYVNEVPWHGLGVKLKNPPTMKEAIIAAGLDWTVSTHRLYYKHPTLDGYQTTPNCGVIRDTDGSYLGTVGTKWTPLQNIDAFEFFQPFLDAGEVELDTAGSLRRGKHVWILARLKGDSIVIVRDDTVDRYLLLANGHDGTMAAIAALTFIRPVCANTLALALEDERTKLLRVIHSENVKENLELVRETIDIANHQFIANAELYRDLARRQINKDDLEMFIKRVFIAPKKLRRLEQQMKELGLKQQPGQRLIDNITPLFEKGRGNDQPGVKGTWWAAYNSVTEYLTHERGRSADIRLDSLWFGQNANTNRRALELAKEMAFA